MRKASNAFPGAIAKPLLIALGIGAPFWSAGTAQASSACLFEHDDFDGLQLCARAEAEVPAIRLDFNDVVSSITVSPGWQIEVCQHAEFQGWCRKYTDDVRSVGPDANDQISSYRIERIEEADPPQACFFEHDNFQGWKFCLEEGENWDAKNDLAKNDMISSMTIEEGLRVTVYQHSDFGGTRKRHGNDVPSVGPEWNDIISSIKVR